jgi:hypothetical protein
LQFINFVLHSDEFSTKDRSLKVACFLETQSIKAILQKIRKPLCEHLVLLSPAWSLSHIMQTSTSFPKGLGISTGIASLTLS